ncbi:hypothetical protein GCM10027277_49390 [Pseudoduganella ginsengisoli]|uniref:Carboxypeptidase regulatory-like domain-containing protein n=1 Tax=Pseudoduganella ginsengisoli TaxID=1462440 RepID=A0A6L6Q531_9BURK|nr:carboxypeptidase regulatory-like domain-containing protein [Pseudoduganella ginsengisoli]MTW04559.1 carboxypeptidase regulatory-like domain-containing protein [Pseudoduganella ginsengisoli]
MTILTMAGMLAAAGAGLLAASMHAGAAGVVYASGGIGVEERAVLESARSEFNLRMTFASKGSGEYRADVNVEIRAIQAPGNPVVLKADNTGPLFYASLPPGRYEVKAQSGGQQQARHVVLPQRGALQAYFYWSD